MHTIKLLFEAVYRVVSKVPVLLEVSPSPVYIIGDIHGNYHVCFSNIYHASAHAPHSKPFASQHRTCTSSWTSLGFSAVARLCLPSFSSLVVCIHVNIDTETPEHTMSNPTQTMWTAVRTTWSACCCCLR